MFLTKLLTEATQMMVCNETHQKLQITLDGEFGHIKIICLLLCPNQNINDLINIFAWFGNCRALQSLSAVSISFKLLFH